MKEMFFNFGNSNTCFSQGGGYLTGAPSLLLIEYAEFLPGVLRRNFKQELNVLTYDGMQSGVFFGFFR
ncbi:hypothetical protein O4H49_09995 [Kiloniella laminariae]|uniref:Uncharacterized protein n=1 Tax=Kiloniella laminariae TaxID=454162 RepID=A0ABT4LJ20_9PROT|nr:hypothetical protein [Kiloniella laminariae]MCZ4281109.1 hypothetical protein [Kiloniella laminariae]